MTVISYINTKGGAGKTTAAIAMGTELARMATVTMIDTDPAQRMVRWHLKNPELVSNINVLSATDETKVHATINAARQDTDFVIVDTEGSASQRNMFIAAASDLIIIPMKPSQMDTEDAIRTVEYIKTVSESYGRGFNYKILFTCTKYVKSKLQRMLMESMREDYPCFERELAERTAFDNLMNNGGSLKDLGKEVSGVPEATENAIAVLTELAATLEEMRADA